MVCIILFSLFFYDLNCSSLQQRPVILLTEEAREKRVSTAITPLFQTLTKCDWCKKPFVSKHHSHNKCPTTPDDKDKANKNKKIYIRR